MQPLLGEHLGRKPIIKGAVLEVLEECQTSLRFSDLEGEVEKKLGREIHPESLAAANKSLQEDGLIEKRLEDGKIVYQLSNQYHKQATKNLLLRLIEGLSLDELSANFDWSERTLPSIVSVSPIPRDTYETADISDLRMGVDVSWETPSNAISSIISNDFLILSSNTRNGIQNLILRAYWVGIQSLKHQQKVDNVTMPPIESNLKKCLEFSKEVLNKARERGRKSQVRTESAIIQILNVTLELLEKSNLNDFLNYANEKRMEVKKAENTILAIEGHFMSSGERIFHRLIERKADIALQGLSAIEEETKKIERAKSLFREPELPMDEAIWNNFVDFLIELSSEDFLKKVEGDYEEAIANTGGYLTYSNHLIDLVRKRQVMVVYLWNIPVKKEAEKYLKIPQFEGWLQALKDGNLSHRIWLFEEETIKDVESAFRAVKRGRKTKPWKIDKEFWTLRDLYELHPRGKNPEFWREILMALRTRKGEEPYRGGPVPRDVYYEFLRKERSAVKELIRKQKKKSR